MNNPYEPPRAAVVEETRERAGSRTTLLLAALGAWAASLYWAALTALIAFGAAMGSVSPTQVILPVVLIGLYAVRGFQIMKGQQRAIRSLMWLHGVGGVFACFQVVTSSGFFVALQAVKVLIHLFGIVTVLMARKHVQNTWLE